MVGSSQKFAGKEKGDDCRDTKSRHCNNKLVLMFSERGTLAQGRVAFYVFYDSNEGQTD